MAQRGKLKVYLGFAPGVGKTCAMLSEAHDLQARGHDVLIGLVEDHGRERTRKLVEGLPVLPRLEYAHRGGTYTELDVEAALEAHPEIILVDELAHTVVGYGEVSDTRSGESKRWHDVYTLLDAGIDVISTMNIQHLESLNDVVAAVTGTRQRETVPDQVLRDADEIELVDLSPDALRIRLARGEVYRQEQAEAALAKYFRVGNLTALRELALLWLADKVDEGLERYRADQEIQETWPTRERVVVSVQANTSAERLIRRGARITGRVAGREMFVVHVAGDDDGLRSDVPRVLKRLQSMTESLGGEWRVLVGDDVPETLLQFARNINASQLVIGFSGRIRSMFGGGTSKRIIDGSGPIDVHIVSTNAPIRENPGSAEPSPIPSAKKGTGGLALLGLSPSESKPIAARPAARPPALGTTGSQSARSTVRRRSKVSLKKRLSTPRPLKWRSRFSGELRLSPSRRLIGWLIGVLGPILLTAAVVPFEPALRYLGAILLGYLTIAVFAGLAAGIWPAMVCVLLGTLLANWFLTQPVHTLTVTEPENIVQLILFAIIAASVSWIVHVAERRQSLATQRLGQAVVLSDLARGVINEGDNLNQLLQRLRQTFALKRVDLQRYVPERKKWVTIETTSEDGISAPWDGGKDPVRVRASQGLRIVVGGRQLSPADLAMIEAHGARITAIIDRQQMEAMRRATAALEAGNRVGTALLAAVSHDLRTPLAGIKAAVSSLSMDDVELDEESRKILIETIESSADRLETVVGNLLDMSRLRSNAVSVQRRVLPVTEVLEAVQNELPEAAGHMDVDVDPETLAVLGDAGLVQRIIANIVVNGRKYAPQSRLTVLARPGGVLGESEASGAAVEIRMIDHGPGIPEGMMQDVFTPFQRLGDQTATTNGLGLGLAVARGFAEAMGGTLAAEQTPGGGATLVLELPRATEADVAENDRERAEA
ncbi:ATP-binding protein [Corynebacterium heidelbergense]|uniref:histidine kinase n=1 Tax=Corynebacterium heidelbergense TaxID=2055947 RepID=A0A364V7Q8_9CORY|nr:ATP-binding protein [Corynebacterium heidelbergense]RAV32606.1 sensor histidine kinase [Corynebacterium heidelbergense]